MKDGKYYSRPGSIKNFRATMRRLADHFSYEWEASTGEILRFWPNDFPLRPEDDYLFTWGIEFGTGSTTKYATIRAFGELPNEIKVVFLDGYHHVGGPAPGIGDAFDEFREMVVREAKMEPIERGTPGGQSRRPPGRPGLSDEELLYRLAKAQEAEERRRERPDMQWKEIAHDIGWNKGAGGRGLALLRDARQRLNRLEPGDPMLNEVAEYRRKEAAKKT